MVFRVQPPPMSDVEIDFEIDEDGYIHLSGHGIVKHEELAEELQDTQVRDKRGGRNEPVAVVGGTEVHDGKLYAWFDFDDDE